MKARSNGYSRRAFLKLAAVGAAGVGVAGWLRISRGQRVVVCSRCAAEFAEGHRYEAGPVRGVYCPNCGVELTRLEHDVRREPMFGDVEKGEGQGAKWDYSQIPFPNSKLVRRTDKPAVVLSEIKV